MIFYETLNNRVRGQFAAGIKTIYLSDSIGSTTATADTNGSVLNTYRYKPFGGILAQSGSSPDPAFLWTGASGSYSTKLPVSTQYNRARHYDSGSASWTSVDKLWPDESAYGYAHGNPTTLIDPTGHRSCAPKTCKDFTQPGETVTLCTCEVCYNPDKSSPPAVFEKCTKLHETIHCLQFLFGFGMSTCNDGVIGSFDTSATECQAFYARLPCFYNNLGPMPCEDPNSDGCQELLRQCDLIYGQSGYPDKDSPPLKCGKDIPPDVKRMCDQVYAWNA